MSCPEWEEKIALYVDGDLPPAGMRAAADHLRDCPKCAELARGLEEDRRWLSSRPPEAAGADFTEIRRAIRHEMMQTRRRRKFVPALLAAAAIVLALATVSLRRTPVPVREVAREKWDGPSTSVVRQPASKVRQPVANQDGRRYTIVYPTTPSSPKEITLEEAMRMFAELEGTPAEEPSGSDSPVEIRIVTRDPNVTIILLQETKGDLL